MRFLIGVIVGVSCLLLFQSSDDYEVHIESYQMGIKHALRTDPVSWELDEACVKLWAGKL